MRRLQNIDLIRGFVMVIMALDHTRDFLSANLSNPTDLTTTTPALFFTRWITHLCAPTFVFLSGVSAWLRSTTIPSRKFLFQRGLSLIIIEFTLVNFALWMDIRFRTLIFEVIGTIGVGFIGLALLYKLPVKAAAIIAFILIAGHDAITNLMLPPGSFLQFIGSFFMGRSAFPMGAGGLFIIGYPVLPWFGIMLAGWCCGRIFAKPPHILKRKLLQTGAAAMILFIILRLVNVYGDPAPWKTQASPVFTSLSFMNVSKYPPSLLFTLVTVGITLLLLGWTVDKTNRLAATLTVYGRTPLFYFIVHLYILHLLMFVMIFLQGFHSNDLQFGIAKMGRPEKGSGLSLTAVYAVWIAVVLLMYPLCKKYGEYKAAYPEKTWLRYL